jgi:hypothetical protein
MVRVVGAAKYPVIHVKKEASWTIGEDTDCPIEEIIGRQLIVIIPQNEPDQVPAIIECLVFLEEIVKSVRETLGMNETHRSIRVVFDVHSPPDGAICGYPIVLGLDWMIKILDKPKATVHVRKFAAMVAFSDLSDAECPEVLAALISIIASTIVVRQPNPVTMVSEVRPLWEQLASIAAAHGIGVLGTTAASFRGSRSAEIGLRTQTEKFSKELCLKTKTAFRPLFEAILETADLDLTAAQLIIRS